MTNLDLNQTGIDNKYYIYLYTSIQKKNNLLRLFIFVIKILHTSEVILYIYQII